MTPLLRVLALTLLTCLVIQAQALENPERRRAFELMRDAKYVEALPLFEKLAADHPEDSVVVANLGFLVFTQSSYLKEPAARKEARKRGRDLLVKAQQLGFEDPVFNALVAGTPPDGGDDPTFSGKKEIDEAMQEGEAAFAKGEFPKALEMYQRALALDPKLYEAALYIGDVHYKTAEQAKACEWFARAVAINPDREAAYRYWGDSLIKQGKVSEAGDKFVESFIAEPYSQVARAALIKYAERISLTLAHPRVDLPADVTKKSDKETTITLDANILKKDDKSGSSGAWLMYSLSRADFASTSFAKEYPDEKAYRHSLKEETTAIRSALKVLAQNKAAGDASLQVLSKLDKEGLLEAYVLLAMPDADIAKDFAAYRQSNVENLRRYVKLYVMTGGGQ